MRQRITVSGLALLLAAAPLPIKSTGQQPKTNIVARDAAVADGRPWNPPWPMTATGAVWVKQPVLGRPAELSYAFRGFMAAYLGAVTSNWLLKAPEMNPIMLNMFADRRTTFDRCLSAQPTGILANEYPAKYLTGAAGVLGLTHDEALKLRLQQFVRRLLNLQENDGYLGPWPKDYEFFEGVIPGLTE